MKFLKEWCKRHFSEIVVGVICSIIPMVLIKVFNIIKEVGPTAGNSLVTFLSNYFYFSLSRMSETSILTVVFAAMLAVTLGIVLFVVWLGFSKSKAVIGEANDILTALHSKDEKMSKIPERSPVTADEIEREANDLIKDSKKFRFEILICFIWVIFHILYIIIYVVAPNIIWSEYKRDMIKIAPYVDSHEMLVIESKWVCMKTKDDYVELFDFIDGIKNEHNLP